MTSTIRFFKFITRTNLEDGKLRIPLGFTRKHGDNMSNPLFLKPPDGKEWKIYWAKKHDGDILFQKGWKDFSTHYSLGHGHIVFFEYEEDTCQFGVNIFNKSTLEIEYPINGIQDEQHNLNHINEEDSVDILDEQHQYKKTRSKSPISCPQPQNKLRTETSADVGRSSKVPKMPKHVQVNELDNTSVSIECLKLEQDQEQEELTSKLKAALDRASNFKSENPFYTFVMKPSYLYNTFLHVPSQFAKKYLKKEKRDILLQVLDGRTWHCKYCPGKIGWKKFVLENNLKVGDICVFELINSQELSLEVLIFHVEVKEELHSPLPQESVDGDGVNSLDSARSPCVGSKTITTNKGGKGTQRTLPGEEVNFTSENPSLTNEALNEANKFTSKNPFFIVNIEPHRRFRPTIPSAFMKKYNLVKKENVLLQFGKNLWPVKVNFHSCKSTGWLSRGWHLFTEVSKLKAGDACVFELINREDGVLHVHIFRVGKATLTSTAEEANNFTLESE